MFVYIYFFGKLHNQCRLKGCKIHDNNLIFAFYLISIRFMLPFGHP